MRWPDLITIIDDCRLCEAQNVPDIRVPQHRKEHAPYPLPEPLRLLFVAIAPPRKGATFWDASQPDRLRDGLLRRLQDATAEALDGPDGFYKAGYFLIPTVWCASARHGREQLPSSLARANCLPHLRRSLDVLQPARILALGAIPAQSLARVFKLRLPPTLRDCRGRVWWVPCGKQPTPVAATYFPGNNRHRQAGAITEAVRQLLAVSPPPM